MILALAVATMAPFAIGTDTDIAALADMASQCAITEARIGRLESAPALYLDVEALRDDGAKTSCLFDKITAHRFSEEFGFVGNAPLQAGV